MNRVTYNLYFEKLPSVRFEPDQKMKADVITSSLGQAIYESLKDLQILAPVMQILKKDMEDFTK